MTRPREGDRGPAFAVGPLTRTDIVRYAGAACDFNPIHHDDDFAHSAGLPSVMAHGMLSAGVLASFVTRWFGPGSVMRYRVRFHERVWPGDELTAEGRVQRVIEDDGPLRAELELALSRRDGQAVVTGSAEVWLEADAARKQGGTR
ncbi:MAG: MaoC/PaaZ C-terminal domain-containing protein [Kiloniellales bacterium]